MVKEIAMKLRELPGECWEGGINYHETPGGPPMLHEPLG